MQRALNCCLYMLFDSQFFSPFLLVFHSLFPIPYTFFHIDGERSIISQVLLKTPKSLSLSAHIIQDKGYLFLWFHHVSWELP